MLNSEIFGGTSTRADEVLPQDQATFADENRATYEEQTKNPETNQETMQMVRGERTAEATKEQLEREIEKLEQNYRATKEAIENAKKEKANAPDDQKAFLQQSIEREEATLKQIVEEHQEVSQDLILIKEGTSESAPSVGGEDEQITPESLDSNKLAEIKEKSKNNKGFKTAVRALIASAALGSVLAMIGCAKKPNQPIAPETPTTDMQESGNADLLQDWQKEVYDQIPEYTINGELNEKLNGRVFNGDSLSFCTDDRETKSMVMEKEGRSVDNDFFSSQYFYDKYCVDPNNPTDSEIRMASTYAALAMPDKAAYVLKYALALDEFKNMSEEEVANYLEGLEQYSEGQDKYVDMIKQYYQEADLTVDSLGNLQKYLINPEEALSNPDLSEGTKEFVRQFGKSLEGKSAEEKNEIINTFNNIHRYKNGVTDKIEYKDLATSPDAKVLIWMSEVNGKTTITLELDKCRNDFKIRIVIKEGEVPEVKIIPDPGGGEKVQEKNAENQKRIVQQAPLAGEVTETDSGDIGEVTEERNIDKEDRNEVKIQPSENGGTKVVDDKGEEKDYKEKTDRDKTSGVIVDKSDPEANEKQDEANENEITDPGSTEDQNSEIDGFQTYSLPGEGTLVIDDNGNARVIIDQGGNNG